MLHLITMSLLGLWVLFNVIGIILVIILIVKYYFTDWQIHKGIK